MIKLTVLYHQPKDATAFESYYSKTHMPLAAKTEGVVKAEYTKFLPGPQGSAPAYTGWKNSASPDLLKCNRQQSFPEGKAIAADLQNFATGGVTLLFGTIKQNIEIKFL